MKCKNCNNLHIMTDLKNEIIGKWCPNINDCPDIEIERECEYRDTMTNADRIRNMSDEELAEFLLSDDFYTDCDTCKEPESEYGDCIGRCENELLRWLQKEVE